MATISEQGGGAAAERPASGSSMTGWMPANPAPLGLMGFGITTVTLSFINANIVGGGAASFPIVMGMALAFGGLAQLLAGMWEFRTGNTFGAVAFSGYGAFWISFFILVMFNVGQIVTGAKTETDSLLGLYLWMWGLFTFLLFLCTFKSPLAIQLVFATLVVTYVLLGIGNTGAHATAVHWGGYVGIACGALALYAATGDIMKAVYKRDVLPFCS